MKNIRWTLLALLLAAAPQVAHAQAPTEGGATGQAGTISNDTSASSTTTTTTTTTTEGISPAVSAEVTPVDTVEGETDTLPNTGGEPIIMTVVGLAVAASAFGLRRKVTA